MKLYGKLIIKSLVFIIVFCMCINLSVFSIRAGEPEGETEVTARIELISPKPAADAAASAKISAKTGDTLSVWALCLLLIICLLSLLVIIVTIFGKGKAF